MNDQIGIIDNYHGLKNFIVFIDFKDVFIRKNFNKVKNITFAMRENTISRHQELELATCKYNITHKINKTDYLSDNSEAIATTHQDIIDNGYKYSWLQVLQINQIKKENNISTKEAIEILEHIYSELLD